MTTNPQNQVFSAWENVTFQVTMVANGSIAGASFILNIRDKESNALLYSTTAANILNVGSATAKGVITVGPLTSAVTGSTPNMPPGDYLYDIWRTDDPNQKRLTYGDLTILTQQWK